MALAALLLLSGCSTPTDPPVAVADEPRFVVVDPIVLAEGDFPWHDTTDPLGYYNLASQAVAHPCVWDGGGSGEEVYFNNLKLPTGRAAQGLGEWSGNLSVTLDWSDEDWLGTALRIAYTAPGLSGLREEGPVERGSTLVVPIRMRQSNSTDDDASTSWGLWVCLPTNTLEPEQPFVGSVQAKAVFAPDPVPASDLAGDEDADEGRMARSGSQTDGPGTSANR